MSLDREPVLSPNESGRRELADWIASPQNPLTARVFVDRVLGLAFRFWPRAHGGQFRHDWREAVASRTARLPGHPICGRRLGCEEAHSGDRALAYLAVGGEGERPVIYHSRPSRLFAHANHAAAHDAEQIRDALLTVSGQLKLDYLGPNIGGAGDIDANTTAAQNTEYNYVYADTRRSVYTPAFRNKRLELFDAFDFGDINATMGQRNVSTVAPQALFMLNHPFVVEQARKAAEHSLALAGTDDDRIVDAFRQTLGRAPSPAEMDKCRRFLASGPKATVETWTLLHQTLFACVDFRYLD